MRAEIPRQSDLVLAAARPGRLPCSVSKRLDLAIKPVSRRPGFKADMQPVISVGQPLDRPLDRQRVILHVAQKTDFAGPAPFRDRDRVFPLGDIESHEDFAILVHGPPSVHEARLGTPEQPSFFTCTRGCTRCDRRPAVFSLSCHFLSLVLRALSAPVDSLSAHRFIAQQGVFSADPTDDQRLLPFPMFSGATTRATRERAETPGRLWGRTDGPRPSEHPTGWGIFEEICFSAALELITTEFGGDRSYPAVAQRPLGVGTVATAIARKLVIPGGFSEGVKTSQNGRTAQFAKGSPGANTGHSPTARRRGPAATYGGGQLSLVSEVFVVTT